MYRDSTPIAERPSFVVEVDNDENSSDYAFDEYAKASGFSDWYGYEFQKNALGQHQLVGPQRILTFNVKVMGGEWVFTDIDDEYSDEYYINADVLGSEKLALSETFEDVEHVEGNVWRVDGDVVTIVKVSEDVAKRYSARSWWHVSHVEAETETASPATPATPASVTWTRVIYNAYEPDNILTFTGKPIDEGERYRLDIERVSFSGRFKDGSSSCWIIKESDNEWRWRNNDKKGVSETYDEAWSNLPAFVTHPDHWEWLPNEAR